MFLGSAASEGLASSPASQTVKGEPGSFIFYRFSTSSQPGTGSLAPEVPRPFCTKCPVIVHSAAKEGSALGLHLRQCGRGASAWQ